MSLLDALLLDPAKINVWIAFRTDTIAGTGTYADPLDGSSATKLDTILNDLAANTRIHFGPGVFQINGLKEDATSSWLKSGMKIVGSGIDVREAAGQLSGVGFEGSTVEHGCAGKVMACRWTMFRRGHELALV